jgi:adenylate cyclase
MGQPEASASPSSSDVTNELERILGSDEFQASARNRSFLRYVTEQTLAGHEDSIKAYSIACNVFGRPHTFDPRVDPIVRVEAGNLRRALERYYLTAGASDPLRIEIPKGAYVPAFRPAARSANRAYEETADHGVPRVAVLPFALLSDYPSQSHFANGLSAEIAVALGAHPGLVVTCRYAALDLESHSSLAKMRELLNARFVLEGIVRRSLDRIRITVQLADLQTERQIWGKTFDRELTAGSLFEVEDEIIRRVVEAVASPYSGAVPSAFKKENRRHSPKQLSAYEAVLYQHQHNQQTLPETYAVAKSALERAVRIEPEYADAWAALGELRCDAYTLGYGDDRENLHESIRCARTALDLDPTTQQAWWVIGLASLALRDGSCTVRAAEALLAPPTTAATTAWAGWLLALIGEWERGLDILLPQLELQPGYPAWLHHAEFLYHYQHRDYEAALESSKKFDMPSIFWDPLDRASVLGQLGRSAEAKAAIDEMLRLQPKVADDPLRFLNCFIFQDELVDHVLEGLKKAGLGD